MKFFNLRQLGLGAAALCLLGATAISDATNLADQPVFATSNVPGNLALALSVEWPTASRTAHTDNYSSAATFLGYFDPNKCYSYQIDTTANGVSTVDKGDSSYFYPAGVAANRTCVGANANMWSGNFLNWAATSTIDPFRWAMTGGRRVVDTAATTILEKGWHSGQGLFDDRDLPVAEIAGATPFKTASRLGVSVGGRGFKMRLSMTGGGARSFSAQYFNNVDLSGAAIATVPNDSGYHDWGTGRPTTGINADNFSARFLGTFTAPETGSYTFRTVSDDGIRLWVDALNTGTFNNQNREINNWVDHGSTTDDTAPISMVAGQTYRIRIDYYERGGGAVMQLLWRKPSASAFIAFNDDSGDTDYTMRTKVCDATAPGGVEANCRQYGNGWKPEGLIQQYSRQMRFSAFGYLNQSGNDRDGGVMRARQKFVGPIRPVPGLPDEVNTDALEWSSTDGVFVRNPDAADATATSGSGVTISDSGVINYLNKFGQLIPGNYKSNDPVGELYYAALRYFRNLGNVPEWSNITATGATRATQLDGFPVITNWNDPIQYSCQRNFVLGIGDIYTHADKNVPGNTNSADEPALPTAVSSDPNPISAVTSTNRVGVLQSMGTDLGTRTNVSGNCCSNNSARMAGLAFDANINDIRPDVASQANTIGKQTVQTYWVDVLEQNFQANNQFYLAAKFGGMKAPQDFAWASATPASIRKEWWSTSGETLRDTRLSGAAATQDRPDNYFTAGRPDTMVSGLKRAFASIANDIKSFTTSFALSTVQVSSLGAASYAAQYDSNGWTGVVSARQVTFTSAGVPTSTAAWTTAGAFETQLSGTGWDTGRRIVTWNGSAGVPFRSGSLPAGQLQLLDTPWTSTSGDDSANYLNYLRGDRTNERTSDGDSTQPYRHRNGLLGDVVNAKVTPVGPPSFTFSESVNPGYAAFKTAKASRPTMLYVGANDGMLHAFVGGLTDTDSGKEQFAYVPKAVFGGPSGTPTLNGLVQLGNPNYEHRYYVDATPVAFDVDLNNAGGTFTSTSAATSRWRSLLIGGLGKGGKSYYALDITDPATITTEAIAQTKVKWEFTDSTMGFSYGSPLVVKTAKYGWVVVLTSGYNNSDGYGYIYLVNPDTGVLLEKMRTGTASNGLAQATAYVQDFTDGIADAIYAGDLNGQVWRFDVSAARGSTGSYPAPLKLATVSTTGGVAQPITTQPLVEIDPRSKRRYLMFGTGQLLDTVDINSATEQTFYAIVDGTATRFGTAGDLPSGIAYPITRADLTAVTNADLVGNAAIDFANKAGWRLDLGVNGSGSAATGWRVIANPSSVNGIVAFTSLLTTGNACSPAGQSRVYGIDFAKGKSALTDAPNGFNFYDSAITDLRFVNVDRNTRLVAGDVEGVLKNVGITPQTPGTLRLLNWREIPTVD